MKLEMVFLQYMLPLHSISSRFCASWYILFASLGSLVTAFWQKVEFGLCLAIRFVTWTLVICLCCLAFELCSFDSLNCAILILCIHLICKHFHPSLWTGRNPVICREGQLILAVAFNDESKFICLFNWLICFLTFLLPFAGNIKWSRESIW